MTDIPELSDERFSSLFEGKFKKPLQAARAKQSAEGRSMQAEDGRLSSTANAKGLVQLNARVPLDLKNQVIEEKRRTGLEIGEVIAEALRAYFRAKQG
jgi:hypothetical protein